MNSKERDEEMFCDKASLSAGPHRDKMAKVGICQRSLLDQLTPPIQETQPVLALSYCPAADTMSYFTVPSEPSSNILL